MLLNRSLSNGNDSAFYYERHQLMVKGSMEQFAKTIYPRVYEIIRSG
jgi:hypothetical protein